MKITVLTIVFMFLASALIIPVGTSYAAYSNSSAFTTSGATTSNQTNTNMTASSTPPANQTSTNKASHTLSPLKQFKSGVLAKDVQCQLGYDLVIKAVDGSPACVHSPTVQILIQRGWATIQ